MTYNEKMAEIETELRRLSKKQRRLDTMLYKLIQERDKRSEKDEEFEKLWQEKYELLHNQRKRVCQALAGLRSEQFDLFESSYTSLLERSY